jgi:hypothetical protein
MRDFLSDLLHVAADTLPIWRDMGLIVCSAILIGCLILLAGAWQGTK